MAYIVCTLYLKNKMLKYILPLLVFFLSSTFVYAAPASTTKPSINKTSNQTRYRFIDFTEDGIILIDTTTITEVDGFAGFYMAIFLEHTNQGSKPIYAGFDCRKSPNFFFVVPDEKGEYKPTKLYSATPNTTGYKMFNFVCGGKR